MLSQMQTGTQLQNSTKLYRNRSSIKKDAKITDAIPFKVKKAALIRVRFLGLIMRCCHNKREENIRLPVMYIQLRVFSTEEFTE